MENFGIFPNCKLFGFFQVKNSKLKIFDILQTANCLDLSKLKIFGIFLIAIFRNFPDSKIKISKFKFFEILQIASFLDFSKLQFFGIFQIGNFYDCPNWRIIKFLEFFQYGKYKFPNWNFSKISKLQFFFDFSKLQIFGIFLIAIFRNFPYWRIIKFLHFFHFGKSKFGSKNWQFWKFSSIPHYLQFWQFSYLHFDINQFY